MVREFTELQGTMGGIYAREEGLPEAVWKAIYYHYLPMAVEAEAPPSRESLGEAAVTWAAVSLADKLDTLVGLFAAGERPTGSRDPYGLRRQAHGVLRILADLPDLTGLDGAARRSARSSRRRPPATRAVLALDAASRAAARRVPARAAGLRARAARATTPATCGRCCRRGRSAS